MPKREVGSHTPEIERQQNLDKEVKKIWHFVLNDRDARWAFKSLRKHGWDVENMACVRNTSSYMIASTPLLPNKKPRFGRCEPRELKKHRASLRYFRLLARQLQDPAVS